MTEVTRSRVCLFKLIILRVSSVTVRNFMRQIQACRGNRLFAFRVGSIDLTGLTLCFSFSRIGVRCLFTIIDWFLHILVARPTPRVALRFYPVIFSLPRPSVRVRLCRWPVTVLTELYKPFGMWAFTLPSFTSWRSVFGDC